jgi:SAM-dependent methyltransferase
MNYCFDIDGTLCTNTDGDYEKAEPFPDTITLVNQLVEAGHDITLFTARGSTTGVDWREITEGQMAAWGVRYTRLLFGKPFADVYVDDKGIDVASWLKQHVPSVSPQDSDKLAANPAYLDVTYSTAKEPYTDYPNMLAKWISESVLGPPGLLVDVGCGRGEYLAAFERLGYRVAGVDISPRAAELGKGFLVLNADLEKEPMPFPEGGVDYVFSKSVVEHLNNPTAVLTKCVQALRAGGKAVIMTPSWRHTYWGPFYIDHTHVTPFTAPALAEAMTMAGFAEVKCTHFYQLPVLWRHPYLRPLVKFVAALPLPYRPLDDAVWPQSVNKFIRFSKEVMLLAVGTKPDTKL